MSLSPPLNEAQIQGFIDTQNGYRQDVNPPAEYMPGLTWDNDLATSAGKWAAKCNWQHSGTPGVGENMYASYPRVPTNGFKPADAVNDWGSEKQNYNFANNSCAPGQVCGHYTQMVWADSAKVGCGVESCPKIQGLDWPDGGNIVVCQYTPPGNYIGRKPYQAKN